MPVNNSITVTNGSSTVTGYLTQFVAAEGDLLVANGLSAEILSRESTSSLTLSAPWPGTTQTDVTNFRIMKTAPYWHSNVSIGVRVVEMLRKLDAGMPFKVDAAGTLAQRSSYDDRDGGFVYLSTDSNPASIYIKRSATAGDWTPSLTIQGTPGEPGPPGPAGTGGSGATGVLPSVTYTASRTLTLADANTRLRMNLSSSGSVTVPANASVAFPTDTEIQVYAAGTGTVTIVPSSGVSITPSTGLSLTAQGSWIALRKVGTNAWDAWSGGTVTSTPPGSTTLGTLSLSSSTIEEGSSSGTLVGAVIGKTPNSTLSLTGTAGGRFALSGSNIVAGATATSFAAAGSHQITITETLTGATNTPNATTLTITVTPTTALPTIPSGYDFVMYGADYVMYGADYVIAPIVTLSLSALSLSASTIPENTAAGVTVGAIQGTTAGSTLSLTNTAGGRFALSGTNIVTGSTLTDYETATSHSITITETLSGATNSPRATTLTINVTDVSEGSSTPPFTAPSGYQWPTQVNPVTHNRDLETIWGSRPSGSNSALQDRAQWRVTVTRQPYAFSSTDNNEIRIEVRSGDLYSEPDWTDANTSERSEFQCTLLPTVGIARSMEWESRFEGSTNTATWCVIMQCFARGAGGSPPLALTFESNDTLHLITRTDIGGNPLENYRYSFTPSRNTYYKFKVEFLYSRTGAGYCRLYVNDVLVSNNTNINMGYSGQTAWEPTVGVYRHEAPETLVHKIRNMIVNF